MKNMVPKVFTLLEKYSNATVRQLSDTILRSMKKAQHTQIRYCIIKKQMLGSGALIQMNTYIMTPKKSN